MPLYAAVVVDLSPPGDQPAAIRAVLNPAELAPPLPATVPFVLAGQGGSALHGCPSEAHDERRRMEGS